MNTDISVVIPTLHRAALLHRALESVFRQTHQPREIIVVVDGPDRETIAALGEIRHPALKVIINERSLTAAGARNVGITAATGTWVSFLDDDDEWLPTKLERQLASALERDAGFVSCLSRVVTPEGIFVWPTQPYDNTQPFSAYLFDRRTSFAGAAFIQTSSFLIRRDLLQNCPFRVGSPHDDWDISLRLVEGHKVRLETVPEVLVVHYIDDRETTLSSKTPWVQSLIWAEENRSLMTRRAYSGFCLCVIGPRAASVHDWTAVPRLLAKALSGSPRSRHLIMFVVFWMVPIRLRRVLRAKLQGAQSAKIASSSQPGSPVF